MHKGFLKISTVLGALTVLLGAFAAHALKKIVPSEKLVIFQTGVTYQFFHTLALFLSSMLFKEFSNKRVIWAGRCFIIGIILFCGSLYTIVLLPSLSILGLITPLGGIFFVMGWLLLFFSVPQKIQ
jgi:uncharacterized membrane protein YgdD (TMEM256/DUF423 family)